MVEWKVPNLPTGVRFSPFAPRVKPDEKSGGLPLPIRRCFLESPCCWPVTGNQHVIGTGLGAQEVRFKTSQIGGYDEQFALEKAALLACALSLDMNLGR